MMPLFPGVPISTKFVWCLTRSCFSHPPTWRLKTQFCLPSFFPSLWNRPNSKAGHDYERLKLQCMKAMADLQSLQNQHSTTLKRCEEAVKKADFYQWVAKPTTGPFVNFLTAGAFVLYAFALRLQGFSSYSVPSSDIFTADCIEQIFYFFFE